MTARETETQKDLETDKGQTVRESRERERERKKAHINTRQTKQTDKKTLASIRTNCSTSDVSGQMAANCPPAFYMMPGVSISNR